jgi:hypothetical protein
MMGTHLHQTDAENETDAEVMSMGGFDREAGEREEEKCTADEAGDIEVVGHVGEHREVCQRVSLRFPTE